MKSVIFKFIACADLHIRKRKPQRRIDNFYLTQKRKMAWLFKIAREHQAYILAAGDVFDTSTQPYIVLRDYISLALKYKVRLIAIYGQHDLRYHSYSTRDNTPLAVLLAAMNFVDLGDGPHIIDNKVKIIGHSWEQDIEQTDPNMCNILITHQMVTESGGLWPGHTDYVTGKDLLKSTGYEIIVSGDNHQSFVSEYKNARLFNTGSIVRLKRDQKDYKPRIAVVTVYDDYSIEYDWEYVPIKDPDIVFSNENDTDDVEELAGIKDFVASLDDYENKKPDFVSNLNTAAASTKDKGVQFIIDKVINRATMLNKLK